MTNEIRFGDPHPLGLPAATHSHPVQVLGTGTFGKVYLCCRRTPLPDSDSSAQESVLPPIDSCHRGEVLSEWVAVKIYKPLVQCELRCLEYLKREAVNQRRLNHEHVIGFKEVGLTTDMRLYLTLEYADSGNLKQWLADRGGRLPEAAARWFAQQLVYGLAHCHSYGVYNRDIKPANLLLHSNRDSTHPLEQPLLKVADFGLCKSSTDSAPKSRVGSPHYMAPEVFTGKQYDGHKADVFSCGVVVYQMVFGTLPFSRTRDGAPLDFNRNFREILENIRNEIWRQLLPANSATAIDLAAELNHLAGPPGGLLDLLYGMLRYDPDKRLTLLDVMRHPWYREGLPQDTYEQVLSECVRRDPRVGMESSSPCCQSQPLSSSQSVELIEAEFNRIMEHCQQQQQQQTGVLCHNHQQAPGSAAVGVVEQQTVPGAEEELSLEFED